MLKKSTKKTKVREFPDVIEGDMINTPWGTRKVAWGYHDYIELYDDRAILPEHLVNRPPGSFTIIKHAIPRFHIKQVLKWKKFDTLHLVRACGETKLQLVGSDARSYVEADWFEVVYDDLKT